ncbi:MAG: crotonase/enoyl-CoA hydratase family protein [Methylobacteriaceae bacterium]|nr:crotonase/enoyl-CoA hydratase family protein [Methylobacteriaceae bacterium]
MSTSKSSAAWPHCELPPSLVAESRDDIAILKLNRPEKRNAFNPLLVRGIEAFFTSLPDDVKAVVIHGAGDHFSAGLDLSDLREQNASEGMFHSRMWHQAFEKIEFGRVPVISVLHGAVVGGGLELAASTHIRVAESSAYYALPEGIRGIFVGGGGSVRISRLIGASRMMEMMLTGRTYGADDGLRFALSHYVVAPGEGLAKGIELAKRVAQNAALTNFAVMQALPRIAEAEPATGLLLESMMSSIAQADPAAKERLRDFLEKRAAKVSHR